MSKEMNKELKIPYVHIGLTLLISSYTAYLFGKLLFSLISGYQASDNAILFAIFLIITEVLAVKLSRKLAPLIKTKETLEKKIIVEPAPKVEPSEVQVQEKSLSETCIDLIGEAWMSPYSQNDPHILSTLEECSDLLFKTSERGITVNTYILTNLEDFIREYLKITESVSVDTPEGKDTISKLITAISYANESLQTLLNKDLKREADDITSHVEAFKSKLDMDGFIGRDDSPFKN